MNIDIERLKHDREYWDSVAPEGATHYGPRDDSRIASWYKQEGICRHRWYGDDIGWKQVRSTRSGLIPRPAKQWSGDGLPPVGVECEICTKNGARFRVGVIEAYSRDKSAAMFDFDGLLDCASLDHCMFRPLKSEKERVVEAAMALLGWQHADEDALDRLYDAGFLKMPEGE